MRWLSLFSNSLVFISKLSVQAVFIPLGICLLALVIALLILAMSTLVNWFIEVYSFV